MQTADGIGFAVYLAGPEDTRRGILILHEWWGVKDHNRDWAERFAALDYRAMVVDLYDGRTTDDAEQASQWMREIDQSVADRKLRAALDYLKAPRRIIAAYGCSFGGRESMQASLLDTQAVNATIVAYCRMETDIQSLRCLNGPVLAIYAEQERNWPEKQHDFEAAMAQADKVTVSASYNAAHGFTNPDSPRYDAEANHAAWQLTLDFLDKSL